MADFESEEYRWLQYQTLLNQADKLPLITDPQERLDYLKSDTSGAIGEILAPAAKILGQKPIKGHRASIEGMGIQQLLVPDTKAAWRWFVDEHLTPMVSELEDPNQLPLVASSVAKAITGRHYLGDGNGRLARTAVCIITHGALPSL